MNPRATQKPKIVAAKKSVGKASATTKTKIAKPSSRKPKKGDALQDAVQRLPAYSSRPVQFHECTGNCAIFLDVDPKSISDPQFIERFRAALHTKLFCICFSTDTDVYELVVTPFFLQLPAREEGAQAKAPADPNSEGEAGAAAR